jgi:D-glycero-alpha-D-manno-heptose-7-phosphate kinase
MMLFYTGKTRNSGSILSKQKDNSAVNKLTLDKMRAQSERLFHELTNSRIDEIGTVLRDGWELKKSLASGISDPDIDKLYEKALRAGAVGGKLTGAGGGGFLTLFVPPERQSEVRGALPDLKEIEFKIEPQGSKIIYVGDDM